MRCADDVRERYRRAFLKVRKRLDPESSAADFRDHAVSWTLFAFTRRQMPAQGWKIHIASSIREAPRLFEGVVPYLLEHRCAFKIPASIDDAIIVNSGSAGRTLIGKIVTLYPGDDDEVAQLAADLDLLWRSDDAPEILTDPRLRPGGAIYIRFGAFKLEAVVQDARGLYHHAVRGPDGLPVPDERRLDGMQPPWAHPPIENAQPVQKPVQRELNLCGRRYLLLATLQSAPKGDTFLATDEEFGTTYVIKRVRRGVGENAAGTDCRARLRNESRFLHYLAARGFKSPRLVAAAEDAIALEDIAGIPLHELPRAEIGTAFIRLVAAVAELHGLGVVHRDLKLSNAILAGKDVYLLDFELSAFAGAADAPSGGTPGYMPPQRGSAPAGCADDVFALGASLAHAALGIDPGTLAGGAGQIRALLESAGQKHIARIVAAAMQADPPVRPTARELATRLEQLPDEWPAAFQSCEPASGARAAKTQCRRSRRIMEAAIRSADFMERRSVRTVPIAAAPGPSPHAIASGLAGTILGLAAIDFAVKRSGFDDAMIGAAEALARDVKQGPALGFFTGQSGIAFVLVLAGRKYARADLHAAGQRLFISAAENVVELDLFSGAAGIVWSACLLASVLGAEWPLRAAEPAARRLKESAGEKDGVLIWVSPGDGLGDEAADNAHLGAAHGSAGIALSLAAWGRDAGCARSLDLAREAFLCLFDSGRTSDGRGLRHKLGLGARANCGNWCHGSAGYLWCMLHAFGDDPSLRMPIDWAVRALSDTPLLASPGYCHGMAGQLDTWCLLSRYPRHRDNAGRRAALAARLLEQLGCRASNSWAWPADQPGQIRPDLWTGALGPACALALFQKDRGDTLFSRQTLARIFAPR